MTCTSNLSCAAKERYRQHRLAMVCIWTMGRLEDAASVGCDAFEQASHELNDEARETYQLIRYSPDKPERHEVVKCLIALGIEERAEQVADVLLAMKVSPFAG